MTMKVPSVSDLAQLTTHQLAELLGNVVLLLRRMPDVEVSDFFSSQATNESEQPQQTTIAEKVRREPKLAKGAKGGGGEKLPDWMTE
jgi:hypothetical protein